MYTGDHTIDGAYYLFDSNGVMQTNQWYQKYDGASKYYLGNNGFAVKGWKKIDGKWYYFDSKGYCLTDTSKKIGKKTYKFNKSGVCTNP